MISEVINHFLNGPQQAQLFGGAQGASPQIRLRQCQSWNDNFFVIRRQGLFLEILICLIGCLGGIACQLPLIETFFRLEDWLIAEHYIEEL